MKGKRKREWGRGGKKGMGKGKEEKKVVRKRGEKEERERKGEEH